MLGSYMFLYAHWSTPVFENKETSIALCFYHELASAHSACLKAAQKFFTEHWQQNKMDCGEDKEGGGGGGGGW